MRGGASSPVTERWLPWQFTVPGARPPSKSAGATAVHVGGVTLFWGGRDEYGIRQAKQRCHKLLWQVWVGAEAVVRTVHGLASVAPRPAAPVPPTETASTALEGPQASSSAALAAADSSSELPSTTAAEAQLLPPSAHDAILEEGPPPLETAASSEPTEASPALAEAENDKERAPADSAAASQGGNASEPSGTPPTAAASTLVVPSVSHGALPPEAPAQPPATADGTATEATTTTLEVASLEPPSTLASSSLAPVPVDAAPPLLVPATADGADAAVPGAAAPSDAAAPVRAAQTAREAPAQLATTAPAARPADRRRSSKSSKSAPAAAALAAPARPIPKPIPRSPLPVPAAAPSSATAPSAPGLPSRGDMPYRPRKRPHVKTEPAPMAAEPTPTSGEAAAPTADKATAKPNKRGRPKHEPPTSPAPAPAPAPAPTQAPAAPAPAPVSPVPAVPAYMRPPPAGTVHPMPTTVQGSTAAAGNPTTFPSHATPAAGTAGRPASAATAMQAASKAAAAAATAAAGGRGVPQVLAGPLPGTPAVTSQWLPHVHGEVAGAAAAGYLPGLATAQLERAGGLASPDLPWPAPGSTVTVNGSPIRVLNVGCGTVWLQLRFDLLHQGQVLVCRKVSFPGDVSATPSPWSIARFHDDHVSREFRTRFTSEHVADALYQRRQLPSGELIMEGLSRLTQENAQRLSAMQPASMRQCSVYCTSVSSAMNPLSFELHMFTADTCYEFAVADAARAMNALGPANPAHIFVRVRTSEARTPPRPGRCRRD